MEELLPALHSKAELDEAIEETEDLLLVVRFGNAAQCLHLDDTLCKSLRPLLRFVRIFTVEVPDGDGDGEGEEQEEDDVLVYLKYFDITLLPSTVFFFNAQHLKIRGLQDQTKWVGDFPGGRQDFIDLCEVLWKGAMRGKLIVDCPVPRERLPKYQLLYKDI